MTYFELVKYLGLLILFTISGTIHAQQRISGYVVGDEGERLPGAHVMKLSTSEGTVTNINGIFRITVEPGDTVSFSHIGFAPHYVAIDSSMIGKHLEVRLSSEAIELPSIKIFADVRFRVPRRFKPQPLDIEGLAREASKKPMVPGSVKLEKPAAQGNEVPYLGAGVVINGPFTYFTKEEKERRKAEGVFAETERTIEYQKYVNQSDVRNRLMEKYNLSEQDLDQLIVTLNKKNTGIEQLTTEKQLWFSLNQFIESQVE